MNTNTTNTNTKQKTYTPEEEPKNLTKCMSQEYLEDLINSFVVSRDCNPEDIKITFEPLNMTVFDTDDVYMIIHDTRYYNRDNTGSKRIFELRQPKEIMEVVEKINNRFQEVSNALPPIPEDYLSENF
jgi:hypothetical protein